jgi:homoserine dehydrogenase
MANQTYNLCLLGFGNVNRTLVRLLRDREEELRTRYGISWRITGVATRRFGWIASPDGLDPMILAEPGAPRWNLLPHVEPPPGEVHQWLRAANADVLFEATSLNARDGQPAIDHIRAALEYSIHAITANKGPVVHAYEELRGLARKRGKKFLFESTVMDGVPLFLMFEHGLPAVRVKGFHGVLNSTTNVILTGMEEGLSFEESLRRAQAAGVAETDPTDDIEGWDAAVKIAALARVVMGAPLRVTDIERDSLSQVTAEQVHAARAAGKPFKMVCRASREGNGSVSGSVRLEQVPVSNPIAHVGGTSSIVHFETDIFPGLVITEIDPGLEATSYGMLADFIRAVS